MTIALSWSRLSDYRQCPRKFYLKYIEKAFPDDKEKSVHLIKGAELHKQLENYVNFKNNQGPEPKDYSPEVEQNLPFVDRFFTTFNQVYPESQVACDVNWQSTDWFGKNVAWRGIWDVIGINVKSVFIGDYKSGKYYDYTETLGQLHLSAVMALSRFNVDQVKVAYIYLESKRVVPITVTKEQLPEMKQAFDDEYQIVQTEREFAPKKNQFCGWCPATKSQCKFSNKL